jgi:hypothetical protein
MEVRPLRASSKKLRLVKKVGNESEANRESLSLALEIFRGRRHPPPAWTWASTSSKVEHNDPNGAYVYP